MVNIKYDEMKILWMVKENNLYFLMKTMALVLLHLANLVFQENLFFNDIYLILSNNISFLRKKEIN